MCVRCVYVVKCSLVCYTSYFFVFVYGSFNSAMNYKQHNMTSIKQLLHVLLQATVATYKHEIMEDARRKLEEEQDVSKK